MIQTVLTITNDNMGIERNEMQNHLYIAPNASINQIVTTILHANHLEGVTWIEEFTVKGDSITTYYKFGNLEGTNRHVSLLVVI